MLSNITELLANVSAGVATAIAFVALFFGAGIVFIVAKVLNDKKLDSAKNQSERLIKEATEQSNKLLESATNEAQSMRKEALADARKEQSRLRNEFEEESKQKRDELNKRENKLDSRENTLLGRENSLNQKSNHLDNLKKSCEQREKDIENKEKEVSQSHQRMLDELAKIALLKPEEAKQMLMDEMIEEAKRDSVQEIKIIVEKAREEAEKEARELITQAVQRCAVDQTSDITTSVVELPNDDMKGRLIGRSGRNIKAIENSTGVDVIIDDTPDIVTLSCFDPVRREIARLSVEKLLLDGRIHPSKIEETVAKMRKEINQQMKKAGEDAVFDAGVYGMNPELIKLIGRLKYRTSYGQNMLSHSLEVSYIAGILATELGANVKVARRAGLLHDIGKAVDHEVEGTHIEIGVSLAKRYKESKEVIHCIEAHHNDVDPMTIEALIIQAADAISGARPGARRDTVENYVKRLEKLESIANSFAGVEQSYAIQAGREIRVAVKPDQVDDKKAYMLAKDIAKKLEEELDYPGQIKVNVVRELKCVEYAK